MKETMEGVQHFQLFVVSIWLLIIQSKQAQFEKRPHAARRRDDSVDQSAGCSGAGPPLYVTVWLWFALQGYRSQLLTIKTQKKCLLNWTAWCKRGFNHVKMTKPYKDVENSWIYVLFQ